MQVSFPNPEEPAGAEFTHPYAFQCLLVFVLSLSWYKRAFLFSCEISTKRTPVPILFVQDWSWRWQRLSGLVHHSC